MKYNQPATQEINLSPSTDYTLWSKVKAVFGWAEKRRVLPFEHTIDVHNPLSSGLIKYLYGIDDRLSINTNIITLTVDRVTNSDGGSIPNKLIGLILAIIGWWNYIFVGFAVIAFIAFDGKRKFAKSGLWHDAFCQHGYIIINNNKFILTFTQANTLFYHLSIYYGKSRLIALFAYWTVFIAYNVWYKYRNDKSTNEIIY